MYTHNLKLAAWISVYSNTIFYSLCNIPMYMTTYLSNQVSRSPQDHEETMMALLYSILTDPPSASKVRTGSHCEDVSTHTSTVCLSASVHLFTYTHCSYMLYHACSVCMYSVHVQCGCTLIVHSTDIISILHSLYIGPQYYSMTHAHSTTTPSR